MSEFNIKNNVLMQYSGKSSTVILPEGIVDIYSTAFSANPNKSQIREIRLPSSLKQIGMNAFSGLTGLTQITIPNGVTKIALNAFAYCSGLRSITLPDSVKEIGNYAFAYCTNLKTVILPKSLRKIPFSIFTGCSALDNIAIPDEVVEIAMNAFADCKGLRTITLSKNLKILAMNAFKGCDNLTNISTSDECALAECKCDLTQLYWYKRQGDGPVYLGNLFYKYKGNVPANTSITIKDGTTAINEGAFTTPTFEPCTGLVSVIFPDSLKYIGSRAFGSCRNLKSVKIPDGVISVGDMAFSGCYELKSAEFPSSIKKMGKRIFFYGNSGLQISCKSPSQPESWDKKWNKKGGLLSGRFKVNWGK